MNTRLQHAWNLLSVLLLAWMPAAMAQTFSSGSTGADLAFTGTNQTIVVKPGGVYNYTTYTIPTGVTVTYEKGADNSPLVILTSGDVNILGSINLTGKNGTLTAGSPALGGAAGPGGFNGGVGSHPTGNVPPGAGQGPGGGAASTTSGIGGTYGAPTLFGLTPLFGGSGGGGGNIFVFTQNQAGASGGGGGGAILIASSTKISFGTAGNIKANGGNFGQNSPNNCSGAGGAGSGGAIRLVAPEITGGTSGSLIQALGGDPSSNCPLSAGAPGRIRLEAFNTSTLFSAFNPIPTIVNAPGAVSPAGNPVLANVPSLAITQVGTVTVPAATTANYNVPDITLPLGTSTSVQVRVSAANTPVGGSTVITVRVLPRGTGTSVNVPASSHTGSFASSSATADVTLPAGQVTVLQAHAAMTLTGQTASLFPLIDGEPVERVMVAATPGETSTLSLVTKSGKERRLDQMPVEDQARVARAWDAMKSTRTE